jgi:hypothetical protein
VTWNELSTTLNGGDPPIYYKVEWLNEEGLWTVLNGENPD